MSELDGRAIQAEALREKELARLKQPAEERERARSNGVCGECGNVNHRHAMGCSFRFDVKDAQARKHFAEWNKADPPEENVADPYDVEFRGGRLDPYRIAELYSLPYPQAHALKKILLAGRRGEKDAVTDITEAIQSLERQLQMWSEDEA